MTIGPRRGWPGRRAVFGGFLVAAAAVIVFGIALSASGGAKAAYVVAARPLAAGSVIGPGDTTTARLGLTGASRAAAFRQSGALIGHALAVAVTPGELIESSMLGDTPAAALRPVSIPVESDSLAALATGDLVDVLATPSARGSSISPQVQLVMRGATLLSSARVDSGLLAGGSAGTAVVTLGVSDLDEVEQLVEAAHSGTVELVAARPADGSGLGPPPTQPGS